MDFFFCNYMSQSPTDRGKLNNSGLTQTKKKLATRLCLYHPVFVKLWRRRAMKLYVGLKGLGKEWIVVLLQTAFGVTFIRMVIGFSGDKVVSILLYVRVGSFNFDVGFTSLCALWKLKELGKPNCKDID